MTKFLYFLAGGAAGAAITWFGVKKYYETRYEEDVAAVKEKYTYKKPETEKKTTKDTFPDDQTEKTDSTIDPAMLERYSNIAKRYSTPEIQIEKTKKNKEVIDMNKPFIIMPEEVGDTDYGVSTLYFFNDDVLTDDEDNIIEDPEDLIGDINPRDHFGEYEDDVVFVRNDDMETDFEILARDEERGDA